MGLSGRPMKYRKFLEILEDERIYTPATIMRHGQTLGLFAKSGGVYGQELNGEALALAKFRVRTSLARFASNHGFPMDGDGWISMRGQAPLRGWFGWRWKKAMVR